MNITYKRATENDLEDIINLNNKLFELEKENYDDTLVKDWPLSNDGKDYFLDLIKDNYVEVAIYDKSVVGYLAGTINEKGSYEEVQYGEVNNMYINEDYQGCKIGSNLMNHFKDYLRENGINNIKVIASYKNTKAISFYKKNGFTEFNLELTERI